VKFTLGSIVGLIALVSAATFAQVAPDDPIALAAYLHRAESLLAQLELPAAYKKLDGNHH
jgi:hypothetical protein